MSAPGTISEILYRSDSNEFIFTILGTWAKTYFKTLTVTNGDSGEVVLLSRDAMFTNNPASWTWAMNTPVFSSGNTYTITLDGGDFTSVTPFSGLIQWPHLDCGALGQEKNLIGLDLVTTAPEGVSVSVGYDQRDLTKRTAPYAIDADTLPGMLVPIPVSGPSFDLQITFEPGQAWEFDAANLYVI